MRPPRHGAASHVRARADPAAETLPDPRQPARHRHPCAGPEHDAPGAAARADLPAGDRRAHGDRAVVAGSRRRGLRRGPIREAPACRAGERAGHRRRRPVHRLQRRTELGAGAPPARARFRAARHPQNVSAHARHRRADAAALGALRRGRRHRRARSDDPVDAGHDRALRLRPSPEQLLPERGPSLRRRDGRRAGGGRGTVAAPRDRLASERCSELGATRATSTCCTASPTPSSSSGAPVPNNPPATSSTRC